MSISEQTSDAASGNWLANQPYLLLSITSLCWSSNAIVGRLVAGHIPPITMSLLRWSLAFLIVVPFSWKRLVHDWGAVRDHLGIMIFVSLIGVGAVNILTYWALEYTTALNALLLQSSGPLFVALWSFVLLGVRLTPSQAGGIAMSLLGVLIILLHGDLTALAGIEFNKGDLIFLAGPAMWGVYVVTVRKSPPIHALSFACFTFGCGAVVQLPLAIGEWLVRPMMLLDWSNALLLIYVAVFPSVVAYLCYNRGLQLIGPNRSAPFMHLAAVFGSVLALIFLGERPELFHFVGFAAVIGGVYVASRKPAGAS